MNRFNLALRNENRLRIPFDQNGSVPTILTALGAVFTRAQTRYRWNEDGSLTNLASGVMPITYTPGYGWAYKPEPASAARWTHSNTPSNAAWTKIGYTVSATTEAGPDASLLSTFIAETATTTAHEIRRTQSVSNGAAFTYHAVFKPVGRRYFAIVFKTNNSAFDAEQIVFDTQTVAVLSKTSGAFGGIYQRGSYFEVWASTAATATTTGIASFVGCDNTGVPSTTTAYLGDVNKGFYWFNLQNLSATRTIPPVVVTSSSTVTGVVDILSVPKSALAAFAMDNFSMKGVFTILPALPGSGGSAIFRMIQFANSGATEMKQLYINVLAGGNSVVAGSTANGVVSSSSNNLSATGKKVAIAAFKRGGLFMAAETGAVGVTHSPVGTVDALYFGSGPTGGESFTHLIHSVTLYRSAIEKSRLFNHARTQ